MIALLAAVASLLSFRIRSRTSLELEVIALRHLLSVLAPQQTFKEIDGRPDSDASDDQKQPELAVGQGPRVFSTRFRISAITASSSTPKRSRGSCETLGGSYQRMQSNAASLR